LPRSIAGCARSSRISVDAVTTKDGPGGLSLEIAGLEGTPWGSVAGVRLGKRYVSFYLMAVYGSPELLASVSPELRRRMQGKSCFNVTRFDDQLFAELADFARRSIDGYRATAPAPGKRVT
jgi:hypothetical protein